MSGFGSIRWGALLGITLGGASVFGANCALAQITTDGTLPNNSNVTQEGNNFNITGGTKAGSNLFHSFREFSIRAGETAFFNNAVDVQNIISRVTGSSISNINGLIKANGTANLFLINPNGIIFGQNARLDVGGSFVASTANALAFGNQGFFSATNPNTPELLTINPSALLFNQIRAASIQNDSVADSGLNPSSEFTAKGLRVPDGKSLLLVGGDINMDGGGLFAFGGRVELGGLAGAGTVGLNGDGNNLSLSFPDSVERSDVSLSNGAVVNVRAGNGGSIALNARNLEMTGESSLYAGIESGLGSNNSKAGNISVHATGAIKLNNGSEIANDVQPKANGQGGDVNISASTLQLSGGTQVGTGTFGAGKGGNLRIDASNVQVIGRSADNQFASGLFADTQENSTGDAGDLTIKTNTLLVRDGAQVSASTFGAGKGGNLSVDASNVQVIGRSADNQVLSGLFASAEPNSTGDAGFLTIKTNTLLVRDGARVSITTSGAGKGGNLSVDATDVQLIGRSADNQFGSGLFASTGRSSTGDAGDLTVRTNTLLVRDGAQVSAGTFGAGKGGNLSVDAQNVQIIGTSADNQFPSALAASAEPNSTGDAGDLTIKTNTLLVRDGAQVGAGTFGAGKGGNLKIDAQDVQIIDNQFGSGLFASAEPNSTGNAGDLTIKTNTLLVRDGAQVSASTFGKGKGGNLSVDAQNVQLIGTSADNQLPSALFADTEPNSTGDAGNLIIKTNTLLVRDGAQVSAGTFGAGKGGNLSVDATDVQLIGRSADNQLPSGLFAPTGRNSTGDAGFLTIKTNTLLVRDGARVSITTSGAGKGGNLSVDATDVQLIGRSADNQLPSGLFADAERNSIGDAGDLTIKTNTLLVRDGAVVGASTFGKGKGGNLSVNATDVQVIGRSPDNQVLSGLFADAQENSTGDAGDLTIKTNTLLVRDGAQVNAGTFGAGKGGNLSVDAQDVQIIGRSADNQLPSALFASTGRSTGDAGDLTIKTNTLLVRDGAQVSAGTFGAGKGGNLSVDAQNVQLIGRSADNQFGSGLFAPTGRNSTGDAGDLTVRTNTLLVRDGAEVSVQSLGTGRAGNMTLNARSIRLDNNALLTANAQSTLVDPNREQATININSKDLIITRNSNIRTNATGENVIGGNININTDFLIAIKNSDISANSADFRGGNVRINATGIFGTQFRDVASDRTSDITATGGSPELSGTVQINTPDVDLNSGLINLPSVPVDTKLAQGCNSPNYAKSSFIYTGRGGLPPNPKDILTPDAVQVDWVTLNPNIDKGNSPSVSTSTNPTPEPIVEATGWVFNAKGEVVFTSDAPNTTPRSSWQTPAKCGT